MRFSELEGKTIGVWGVGRETRSFARHAAAKLRNARLVLVVLEERGEVVNGPGLEDARIVGPDRAVEELAGCDVLVRSPGVSIHKPALRALARRGLTITTGTGLWLAERAGERVIGVTGTKGKSTTATLIAHLSAVDRPTLLAGNIGRPALDLLDESVSDWVVLELSSYQIADLSWGPQVAVITNLFKEHVDWHGTEEMYRQEKLRIFALPGVEAAAYPFGNPEIAAAVASCGRRVGFGGPDGWRVVDGGVSDGQDRLVPSTAFSLRGVHNAENLCAALSALEAAGLPQPPLPESLLGVRPLPHRLETVHRRDGVEWVDDSISTTPESSLAALAAFDDRPVVLIAGGLDRGQDYGELARVATAREVALVTLPDTGASLAAEALRAGLAPARIVQAADLAEAVSAARRLAGPTSVVLLSPAAPSYNSYRNFEERGEHFAALAAATSTRS